MKKYVIRLLALSLCLCMVAAVVPDAFASYETVYLPRLAYTVDGGEAYVSGIRYESCLIGAFEENPLNSVQDLSVADTYEGYPVVGIRSGALYLEETWKAQITLSPVLTKIEEGAIGGSSVLRLYEKDDNPLYCVQDHKLFTQDMTVLLAVGTLAENSVPGTVTRIASKVFGSRGDSSTSRCSITIEGNAPEFAEDAFLDSFVTVNYEGGCSGWTTEVLQSYGGDVRWVNKSTCAGHTFSEGEISQAPDCILAGRMCYTCSACGYSFEESIPASGHSFAQGVCGVCGAEDPSFTPPAIAIQYPTVSFEDDIKVNIYFDTVNLTDMTQMGLLIYQQEVSEWNIENAEEVIPGYTKDAVTGLFCVTGGNFAGKELGKELYFAVYALRSDGSYCYSDLVSYSPEKYAYAQLENGSEEMQKLMVALLNFGAEAQLYFGYNTDKLVNRNLTDAQKGMVEGYRSDMVLPLPTVDVSEVKGAYQDLTYINACARTVNFESKFSVNYYMNIKYPVDAYPTLLVWDEETFHTVKGNLNRGSCNNVNAMTWDDTGDCQGTIAGIPAKDIGKPYYMALLTQEWMPTPEGSRDLLTDLQTYSIGAYCNNIIAKGSNMSALAAATVVYGYYADLYF